MLIIKSTLVIGHQSCDDVGELGELDLSVNVNK